MIKGLVEKKDRKLLILGLSEENINRMKKNDDMFFNLDEVGLKGIDVLITTDKVEEDILLYLKNRYGFDIGEGTKVGTDRSPLPDEP